MYYLNLLLRSMHVYDFNMFCVRKIDDISYLVNENIEFQYNSCIGETLNPIHKIYN